MIAVLLETYKLKDLARTGWELRGVSQPESVADHCWGTAFLCTLFAEAEGVDIGKALSIAAVHDLAECITGDFPTRMDPDQPQTAPEKKQKAELAAMQSLRAKGLAEKVFTLWQEYEESITPEALFVRDMNLVDMALQACLYEQQKRYTEDAENPHFGQYKNLDEFFESARQRVRSATAKNLVFEIEDLYEQLK
ncbi:MAG: HD domain-containing protein [Spirochaetia bacterium]